MKNRKQIKKMWALFLTSSMLITSQTPYSIASETVPIDTNSAMDSAVMSEASEECAVLSAEEQPAGESLNQIDGTANTIAVEEDSALDGRGEKTPPQPIQRQKTISIRLKKLQMAIKGL